MKTIAPVLFSALWISSGFAQDLPAAKDKELVESVCTACHNNARIFRSNKGTDDWKSTVDRMVNKGANADDEQVKSILVYLNKYFGPRVNMNKAEANDLQAQLDLSAEEAAAIVKYRTDSGNFKAIEDLQKVTGLDFAKMRLFENRLDF